MGQGTYEMASLTWPNSLPQASIGYGPRPLFSSFMRLPQAIKLLPHPPF